MNLELRLSVEDSPNSAGVAIDSIRCCKLALDRGKGGVLYSPSAFFMKHPPKQFSDDIAYKMTEEFIAGQDIEGEVAENGFKEEQSHKFSEKFLSR
jgi:myo-inositol-1-phosphate synthase